MAAARNVSPAASITEYPPSRNRRASLPAVVVLPTPFTPHHEHHHGAFERRRRRNLERTGDRLKRLHHVLAERVEHRRPVREPPALEPAVQVGHHPVRQVHPDVGPEQDLLHLVDERGVDPAPREKLRETAREALPGAPQGRTQAAEHPGSGGAAGRFPGNGGFLRSAKAQHVRGGQIDAMGRWERDGPSEARGVSRRPGARSDRNRNRREV